MTLNKNEWIAVILSGAMTILFPMYYFFVPANINTIFYDYEWTRYLATTIVGLLFACLTTFIFITVRRDKHNQ